MNKIYFSVLLFISFSFSFEEDIITTLKRKSESYFASHKRTKLELIFNQPTYAPGDTVRFGIAYLNASDLKPVAGRQVVHIGLFDQLGKKKLMRWALVVNGYASPVMLIPKDFPPGNYKLVAFTDWMKNFDRSLFFQQQFAIAGKFSINLIAPHDTLIFFPEGGVLVADMENNMAIRYTGSARNAKVILREGEKELTAIRIAKDSVHVFRFAPQLHVQYVAEIDDGNGRKKFSLPVVNAAGVSIQVDGAESRLRINTEYSSGFGTRKEDFYIGVFNNSGLIFQSHLDFDDNRKNTLLLPAGLPNGIAQLVVFDSKFNLLSTRVIHLGGINNKDVSLSSLQPSYGTRQEVKFDLKIKDKDGFTMPGFYSCRVVNEDLFNDSDPQEMDFLTFQSDIAYSFGLKRDGVTQQAVNNYLIAQSCPWFVWNSMIRNDQAVLFKPQQNLSLSGTASYAKNGKHLPDSTQIMFFLEKGLLGYETRTDKKGNFSFSLLLTVNHPDRFYYTATLKGKDVDDVALQMRDADSTLSFFANPYTVDRNVADPFTVYSLQVQSIKNSYSFFMNTMPSDSVEEPNKTMEDELSGADLTVDLNDYLMMPTMEEVVREIVRTVEYRKINGRPVIRVYTIGKVTNYNSGPLFVIDGMITKDPSYFLGLKPTDVISIKVVRDSKKLFALGSLGANGVILVKTKLRAKIVKEKHTIDFAGLLPESPNSSWEYANPKTPDLRSCLFWTSKKFNGGDGERLVFKTSDDVGKFKVQVFGLTEDGIPFYSEYPFQVKYAGIN